MDKIIRKKRRKKSIRKKISGTPERPRVSVYKSNKNINVQVIDDIQGKTLCSLSTLSAGVRDTIKTKTRKNVQAATLLGEALAKTAATKGVTKVVFDRSGHRYHGVIKALADSARKHGLQF